MFPFIQFLGLVLLASQTTFGYNFPYEAVQLKDSDVANNSDIAFGKPSNFGNRAKCKVLPGDANWPSVQRWAAFNSSLGGALIKGNPPASACYDGPNYDAAKCADVRERSSSSLFVMEDPTINGGQWQTGNSCPLPALPIPGFNSTPANYTCNVNGFPAYVVNATTAKHVQLAVNFARNNNIRLVIKNTGHDFLGRNTGGGSLQVWTHHLKAFEYLPSTRIREYHGMAARVGSSLQQFELHNYMAAYNITLLAPGGTTVGGLGGYMQGGGFSILTSKFGLMADQVLSLEVVTADGRFAHADPEENEDLFWAIRGGGGSTFGVVTSAVIKAYPTITITTSAFNFQTNPYRGNETTTVSVSDETFWKGIGVYFSHIVRVVDAKGIGWNYIRTTAPMRSPVFNSTRTFSFTGQVTLPGFTASEAKKFVAPLIYDLNKVGINITNPEPSYFSTYPKQAYRPNGPGDGVSGGRFGSRLFPRENLEDKDSDEFNDTMSVIRSFVEEGGYTFHSVDYSPTDEIAGYPGRDSAVNPALRNAVMHCTGFDTGSYGPDSTPAQQTANHKRLNEYIQKWRDVSPGAGAYMNEADTEEPDFQQSFYGHNYERLLRIKRRRDPWGVFYAVTGVGSEEWVVEGTNGLPTQQGRLCRVVDEE